MVLNYETAAAHQDLQSAETQAARSKMQMQAEQERQTSLQKMRADTLKTHERDRVLSPRLLALNTALQTAFKTEDLTALLQSRKKLNDLTESHTVDGDE